MLNLLPAGLVRVVDQHQVFQLLVPEPEFLGAHCQTTQEDLHGLVLFDTRHVCLVSAPPVKSRYQRLKEA